MKSFKLSDEIVPDSEEEYLPTQLIELSDDSLDIPMPSIIEISDTSSVSLPAVKAPSAIPPFPIDVIEIDDDEEDVEQPKKRLNLDQFAFKAVPAQPRPLPASSRSKAVTPLDPPKKRLKLATTLPFLQSFTDTQLSSLVKCVCCQAKWTTRKGTAQKLQHIRTCARKHSYSEDTVRVLVQKEVDNTPPLPKTTKDKQAESVDTPTIFADRVQEAAPKKKTRRKAIASTVVDPASNRELIITRASQILPSSRFETPEWNGPDRCSSPPRTQPFHRSALGERQEGSKLLYYGCSQDEDEDAPSSAPASSITAAASMDPLSRYSPLPTLEQFNERPWPSSPNLNARSPAFHSAMTPFDSDNLSIDNNLNFDDPDLDDAYLHYDPDTRPSDIARRRDVSPLDDPSTDTFASNTTPMSPVFAPKAKASKSRKGKEKSNMDILDFDEAWERRIRDRIVADVKLHHRILRYEPIHFNIFVQLAIDGQGKATGKLRSHLRALLDKLAINAYGVESVGRKRN